MFLEFENASAKKQENNAVPLGVCIGCENICFIKCTGTCSAACSSTCNSNSIRS